MNGIYFYSSGGQNAQTPTIATLDEYDFQIDLEFNITALPSNFQSPVLMAGNGWRWIGLYVQANGTVGLKYNNSLFTWSSTLLTAGAWYTASIRYETGSVELFINGVLVHTATLGALSTNNNYNFTTNDFSNGRSHYGCIRNLVISNDTTLGSTATTSVYGTGCDGLVLGATGLPTIGNPLFDLVVSNVPAASPIVFVAFGSLVVNPGVDLGPFGMAGCFAHTNLDLGLFGPAVVFGTSAPFPLPIPNDPSLAGALLATQGVSLSAATVLGLASSNGLQLILGF